MGILTRLFEKRSFDNQQWIQDWLRGKGYGGFDTASSIKINPESAVKYSAVCSPIVKCLLLILGK